MEKFILYVKVNCPFCRMAEDLLVEKNKKYNIVPFETAGDVLEHMKYTYDHQTVPMVFHAEEKNIKFVGGYTDLVEYLNE